MNINEECLLKYLNNPKRLETCTMELQQFIRATIEGATDKENTIYLTTRDIFVRHSQTKTLNHA